MQIEDQIREYIKDKLKIQLTIDKDYSCSPSKVSYIEVELYLKNPDGSFQTIDRDSVHC